jgi:hypothetical protein
MQDLDTLLFKLGNLPDNNYDRLLLLREYLPELQKHKDSLEKSFTNKLMNEARENYGSGTAEFKRLVDF